MAKIMVTTEVSKETYEMGMALSKMIGAIKDSLADGWQPGVDLPVLITSVITNLTEVIQGAQLAQSEMAEDQDAFIGAVALALRDIVKAVK